MAIADTQKIDYLWKKLGYGVAKTDTATNKQAYEEAIASPLLLRGDKLWAQSGNIPATLPTATSSLVVLYKDGTGSWTKTIECTEDTTASDNKTWKTNLTDWVPVEFGSTYQVQVYIDAVGAANPQTTGTKIFAAGSGNNDEWYFDYQAGVLHFIGANIPTAITGGVTGKTIYVSGARYSGAFGVSGSIDSATATLGNLNITDRTISSTDTNGNIILDPNGTGSLLFVANTAITGNLSVSLNSTLGNVATANYFTGVLTTAAQPNITSVGNLTSLTTTGDLTVGGNLLVSGNTTVINTTVLEVVDLNITVAKSATNAAEANGAGLTVNGASATILYNSSTDTWNFNKNLVGTISNATVAVTVSGNAQPNITSVGTLTSLTVTGNVTSGNASLGNTATANFFTGVLITAAQPNITSVGSLTALTVTGNVTSGNATLGNTATANFFTGVLTTAAQPNITSVGNLTSLTTSGNVTIGGNLIVNGTTTTINATTLDVVDLNITVAKNATTAAAANGAGLTVNGASASMLYNSSTDTWDFNKSLNVTDNIVLGNRLSANGSYGNKFDVLSSNGAGKAEWKGRYYYTTTLFDFTEYGMGYMNMAPNQDPVTFGFIPGVEIPYGSIWMLVTNDGSDISPTVTSPNSKSTPMMWTSLDGSGAYDPDTNPTGGDYWFNITPPSA